MPGCLWAKKPEICCNHATLCRADCLAFACEVCRCYYNHGLFDYAILWRGQKAPWDVDLDVYRCSETGLHWHGVAGEQTSESECRSYRRGVWQFKFKLMHWFEDWLRRLAIQPDLNVSLWRAVFKSDSETAVREDSVTWSWRSSWQLPVHKKQKQMGQLQMRIMAYK